MFRLEGQYKSMAELLEENQDDDRLTPHFARLEAEVGTHAETPDATIATKTIWSPVISECEIL